MTARKFYNPTDSEAGTEKCDARPHQDTGRPEELVVHGQQTPGRYVHGDQSLPLAWK